MQPSHQFASQLRIMAPMIDGPMPPATLSARDDAAIIEACLVDPHAFAELYERHGARVARYALSRVGPDDADDIVAGTFAEAFRQRRRFDPGRGRDALPWLLGFATNELRRLRRREEQWVRAGAAQAAAHGTVDFAQAPRAATAIDAQRLAPTLRALLAQLKRGDRDALVLHVVAELSVDEVAVALGIPSGTVKSRLHRARRLMAPKLDEART